MITAETMTIVIQLMIGALSATVLIFIVDYARKANLNLKWWEWLLSVLGLLYTVFVLEVFYGFLNEGAGQAALVMGILSGLLAVIWWVLLARKVFNRSVEALENETESKS
jgi:hypothetical protein